MVSGLKPREALAADVAGRRERRPGIFGLDFLIAVIAKVMVTMTIMVIVMILILE